MERLIRKPTMVLFAAVLLVCVVLAGQALADTHLPDETTSTGAAVGRAGFAYLTGVRTFAAAVLWNRLDPVYHEYYGEKPLMDQTQMMPIINMVTKLNPEFVDAYNVASWVLARRGLVDEALDLAALGVENNPDSGILWTNYAQILWLYAEDYDLATDAADQARKPSIQWRDLYEKHDNYAVLRTLYEETGHQSEADSLLTMLEEIDKEIELHPEDAPAHDHEHDH